jgi:hypothetical protein
VNRANGVDSAENVASHPVAVALIPVLTIFVPELFLTLAVVW